MSENSSTRGYIYSSHGVTPATDESSHGEGSVPQEAERTSSEETTEQSEPEEDSHQGVRPQTETKATRRPKRRKAAEGHLSIEYRNLLNSVIQDAAGTTQDNEAPLPVSHIGGSLWTSAEKDSFFSALALHGPADWPAISKCIVTKSEIEIKAYLGLLERQVKDGRSGRSMPDDVPIADVPAAYEVALECEEALDLAAEALARHVEADEAIREKQKFGSLWLIDADTANEIPNRWEEDHTANESDGPADNNAGDGTIPKSSNDDEKLDTGLLQPDAFLQLSRGLFMNSLLDTDASPHVPSTADSVSEGPAMFRSAFEDFHDTAVNLTRRLVQASLFQATSRLRAKQDRRPKEIVTVGDVRVAVDLLRVGLDWNKYWATAARRCNVEVYTDSIRFFDGRPSTKNGVLLTYDEVESELGLAQDHESESSISREDRHDQDTSDAGREFVSDEGHSDTLTSSDSASENDTKPTRLPKRKYSSDSTDEAGKDEDTYLDLVDRQASKAEGRRLWKLLRRTPTLSSLTENVDTFEPLSLDHRGCRRPQQWRRDVKYEAEWERRSL